MIENVEKGGDVVIIGVFSENPKVNIQYYSREHELNVLGSMMYKHEDYEEAVDKIAKGQITLDPLMSKHFDLENFIDAYHYIDQQGEKSMKVFIDFLIFNEKMLNAVESESFCGIFYPLES